MLYFHGRPSFERVLQSMIRVECRQVQGRSSPSFDKRHRNCPLHPTNHLIAETNGGQCCPFRVRVRKTWLLFLHLQLFRCIYIRIKDDSHDVEGRARGLGFRINFRVPCSLSHSLKCPVPLNAFTLTTVPCLLVRLQTALHFHCFVSFFTYKL